MMITPRPNDALHKAWLMRLLSAIADNHVLSKWVAFKGGTCAAMRGFLNRFSVDLDFDLVENQDHLSEVRHEFETIFSNLNLHIKDKCTLGVQYFVKYSAPPNERSTVKLDTQFPPPRSNQYEKVYFSEIDRTLITQTQETMVSNKLVAVLSRWETHRSIAGRDLYDIRHFFINSFSYSPAVIEERMDCSVSAFFERLITFIRQEVSARQIEEDINILLPKKEFQAIRQILKQEVLMVLEDEHNRLRLSF